MSSKGFQKAVRDMRRLIAPIVVVAAVLAVGLLLWWPPEANASRRSDLGTALIGGAVAAVAVLYLQWRMSIELSKQQRIHDEQFNKYLEL
jgi:hypothetical protein